MKLLRTILACLCLLQLWAGSPALAQTLPPDAVTVSTPVYHPSFEQFDPPLGRYTYRVSWEGIPAADIEVEVRDDNMDYRVVADARTYSGIDWIYKLRYRAEGLLSAIDLRPVHTSIEHRENSRVKRISLDFKDNGQIYSEYNFVGRGNEIFDFKSNNFTLDPFSAAFLARSLDWQVGETKSFDTFNGKSRYLIRLTAKERTTIEFDGQERDVWVVSPEVDKLTEPNAAKKLRNALIYVSADKNRDILKIVSSVFIGSVTTKLISFEPFPSVTNRIQLAQLRNKIVK